MSEKYKGYNVETVEDLQAFTGSMAIKAIVGEERREAFRLNYEQMKANYNGGVDFELRARSTLLCPQTAAFLYSKFTPTTTNFQVGSRPVLEDVVRERISGLKSQRDIVLTLMRFCRDLYKKNPDRDMFRDENYMYGGTEEELIDKGEALCECLGRLFVSLCEIAGFPARWVIHIVGGHIVSEVYLEGKWAYIDPTTGVYFIMNDGRLANTWELWNNPEIVCQQPDAVKADVSGRWTWYERVWRCKKLFFHPDEITAFANYRLSDAHLYNYSQVSQSLATQLGMWNFNKKYRALTNYIFGLSEDGWRLKWSVQQLRKRSMIYRTDGFTPFFLHPSPMTPAQMFKRYIDPLAGTNVDILEWGMGPGSVFCYDTKVGEVFGESLTDEQRSKLREGDRRAWRNVTGMIASGVCPLKAVIDRGHEIGLKVYTRLEMNHEYGPASDDNWMWIDFVGNFNKKNPQFRIPGCVNLDFKHAEVRRFKLSILREAAERGSDCISMDFAVYPPFFEIPDTQLMTQFVRDVRIMADEVGVAQNRRIELMVRVPAIKALSLGLNWQEWMREKIVDAVVPTPDNYGTIFDLNIDEFISLRNRTGVKVYGCLFQTLGFCNSFCNTDPTPEDEKIGPKYDRPKTKEMWYAQAMLFHRAGVDGIQLAMAADEWNQYPLSFYPDCFPRTEDAEGKRLLPFFNDLADPFSLLYAAKRYKANQEAPFKPTITLTGADVTKMVGIRIADDPVRAAADKQKMKAELIIYCNRFLNPDEEVMVMVNGRGRLRINARFLSWDKPIPERFNYFDPDWWRAGEYVTGFDAKWLQLGPNNLEFSLIPAKGAFPEPLGIRWVDLKVAYSKNNT